MKKIIKLGIGLGAILFAMTLNLQYANNDYGILENTLSTSVLGQSTTSATESEDSGAKKVKTCREVGCTGTWTGTTDANGCIYAFGKKRCNFGISITVTFTYDGKKENCTGGGDWYDCNACQSDCVGSSI